MELNINLEDPRYAIWAADPKEPDSISGPDIIIPEGFQIPPNSVEKTIGHSAEGAQLEGSTRLNGQSLAIVGIRRHFYNVYEHSNHVSEYHVDHPVKQPVKVNLFAVIVTQESLSEPESSYLAEKFNEFDPSKNGSVEDYIDECIQAFDSSTTKHDIAREHFKILFRFELERDGPPDLDAIQTHIDWENQVRTNPEATNLLGDDTDSIADLMTRRDIQIIESQTIEVEPRPFSEVKKHRNIRRSAEFDDQEQKILEIKNPVDLVNEIIDEDIADALMLECDYHLKKRVREEIATILRIPEFKVEWVPFEIKIGCVRIVLKVPILFIGFTDVILWSYTAVPDNAGIELLKVASGCLVRSVLLGAVIGVVTANFATAQASFNLAFKICMDFNYSIKKPLCMLPGLALTESFDGWQRV